MAGTRRAVLGAGVALAAAGAAGAKTRARVKAPLIVSTWDFGAAANAQAFAKLKNGGAALDAVEAGARVPEADVTNHSVGLGGYPDRDGHVTCDASIMDDAGRLGSVAALEDIVHAVSVARRVMEKTPHTLLVADGALQFALAEGFPRQNLLTPDAEKAWREWLKTSKYHPQANIENTNRYDPSTGPDNHDTIGILALDGAGRIAGACTTSGMAFKMHGRVGDSPLAGSGLFVEPGVGAATSTGVGEEVMRIVGSARVTASMRAGLSPAAACREAVMHIKRLRGKSLTDEQVGFLAIDRLGRYGAFALQPGFTYAVTDAHGETKVLKSESLAG
ncbi:MAG TPA: N(4)-(beta-N-acetylglucosaminyl)-L-asparaginase [Caulobacteraceae bacterium]|jgi:N4-(beta-N-acetylglucosaminyl)-L-asparaginase|nr:N(4)-(beta-N-acetylglucosaminyl)-L-asparaginase [Caulobacteraceae bacterium]